MLTQSQCIKNSRQTLEGRQFIPKVLSACIAPSKAADGNIEFLLAKPIGQQLSCSYNRYAMYRWESDSVTHAK